MNNKNKKLRKAILEKLYKIIYKTDYLIVLFDEDTNLSCYCANEIRYALKQSKAIIF